MPFSFNLKLGIDVPVFQWMRFLPVASAAGCCMCTDERGTNRYIYFVFAAAGFWRYDTYTDSWQQLANPSAFVFAAGTWPYASGAAMVGDGMVFIQTPDGAKFLYYRRQTGTEFWRMLIGWY